MIAPPPPPPPKAAPPKNNAQENPDEPFDPPEVLKESIAKLSERIKKSKYIVAFTGAGISTGARLPDYRSADGILSHGITRMKNMDLDVIMPTFAHMLLVALHRAGKLKCVVTSNHDNLHRRSGLPAEAVVEMHGNVYEEMCTSCGKIFTRQTHVPSLGAHLTGRTCEECNGQLKDTGVDFGFYLPQASVINSRKHAEKADLALVLGSSLRVSAAFCELPQLASHMIIVNMQKTPKDSKAELLIRAKIDDVMRAVAQQLHIDVPQHVLHETHVVTITQRGNQIDLLVGAPSKYDHPTVLSNVLVTWTPSPPASPLETQVNDDGNFVAQVPVAPPAEVKVSLIADDYFKKPPVEFSFQVSQESSASSEAHSKRKVAEFSATIPFDAPPPLRARPVTGGGLLGAIKRFPGKEHLATRPDL